jgi:glutathione S-transferase
VAAGGIVRSPVGRAQPRARVPRVATGDARSARRAKKDGVAMKLTLHYHPLSTYSQKVLVAFHEKGIAFEPSIVNLMDPAGRAEYLKVYPLGKIPSLVREDGWFIPESTIIIEYLEGHFRQGQPLIPDDRDEARQVRFMDRMFDHYVNDTFTKIFFDARTPETERDPKGVAAAKATLDTMYGYLDRHLAERTWLVGERFSMGECAAAPPLGYLRMTYPFERYANVAKYWQRLEARPSVARVLEEAKPYLKMVMGG